MKNQPVRRRCGGEGRSFGELVFQGSASWACAKRKPGFGPPKVMKMGASGDKLFPARNGRDRFRSGEVEAVGESDPDRLF
jgi:hypothetical protein